MAVPTAPTRSFDFAAFAVANPTTPPPGDQLNNNMDATNAAIAAAIAFARNVIADDGSIKAGLVTSTTLAAGLLASITASVTPDLSAIAATTNGYAGAAAASATTAAGSVTSAAAQATAAAGSATAAAGSASSASGFAGTASTAATNAGNSATNASNSAGTATTQAGSATNSAALARQWAEQLPGPLDSAVLATAGITGQHYSAAYYANQAALSAAAAATSTANVSTIPAQVTAAANSASAAATSASNASGFASSASSFATQAQTAAANAQAVAAGGVTSFNTRGGAVTLTQADVTTALAGAWSVAGSGNLTLGNVAQPTALMVRGVASGVNYMLVTGNTTGGGPMFAAQGTDTDIPVAFSGKGAGAIQLWSNGAVAASADSPAGAPVNNFILRGTPTAGTPTLFFWGGDTNVNGAVGTKGTGSLSFLTNTSVLQARVTNTASAVNYLNLTGAATGGSPALSAQGTDTNVNLVLASKGAANVVVQANGAFVLAANNPASAVNYMNMAGGATGGAVTLGAAGADTAIQVWLQSKGTAAVVLASGGTPLFTANGGTSAVNYFNAAAAATTASPTLSAVGNDTDINMIVQAKGAGTISLRNANGMAAMPWAPVSGVNYLALNGAATGAGPAVIAQGTDTNINLLLASKGTGSVALQANSATALTASGPVSGVNYIAATGAITGTNPSLSAQGADANIGLVLAAKGTSNVTLQAQGANVCAFGNPASSVNYAQVSGNVTGGGPAISAVGADTNINLVLTAKGTGSVIFRTQGNTATQFIVWDTPSAVNNLAVNGATAGNAPRLSATGSDTNISMTLAPQGTGNVLLTTDSTAALGVATKQYADSAVGFRNRIINGCFRVDQRNAGAAVTTANNFPFTLDRWQAVGQYASLVGAFSVQQVVSPVNALDKALKVTVTTAQAAPAATDGYFVNQPIEGQNVADFQWGTAGARAVQLTFNVQASVTGTFSGSLRQYNGTTYRSYPFTYTIAAANTATPVSITIPGDTAGSMQAGANLALNLIFDFGSGTTYAATAGAWAAGNFLRATGGVAIINTAAATWTVTNVQLECASSATPFERRPFAEELRLCQRYFNKTFPLTQKVQDAPATSAAGAVDCFVAAGVSAYWGSRWTYPVTMRVQPTMAVYSYNSFTGGAWLNASNTAASAASVTQSSDRLALVCMASGSAFSPAATDVYYLHLTASAEL